ncbi:tRNA (adenosine(37)-N6)-dimethylallyltransferase MiaA [Prosthecomicrobium sp. N25]|uniref:tRNA (adenosine(37)-N6)-dimethylallyltransferase MiaA n=1 Tax=Prosthecomicrobium sp. N25 TaxID=3129254 RepID=UPI003076D5BB
MTRIEGRPRAVLIAGATASGKSALALRLAGELGGAVVNADSMQVYRELEILTARPGPGETAQIPHRLYGHVPAATAYSVAAWRADVARELEALDAAGLVPVLTGGTGLYLRSLLQGLSAVPSIPDEVRSAWRGRLAAEGAPALHRVLAERDPAAAARLEPGDGQRIVRALEIVEATGRTLGDFAREPGLPPLLSGPDVERIVLAVPRAALHARIDRRFRQMVEAGALAEAERFDALGLDPALPASRAIGLRPLAAAARGEIDLEAAIRQGQAETRQYAKRQETWFRNQMADWTRWPA